MPVFLASTHDIQPDLFGKGCIVRAIDASTICFGVTPLIHGARSDLAAAPPLPSQSWRTIAAMVVTVCTGGLAATWIFLSGSSTSLDNGRPPIPNHRMR
ncbi:MAG TPA: hypothetical protein PLK29_08150 [Chiayiivirga sp.]|nr:hypothetical protein [Chiayiivirga sp.]